MEIATLQIIWYIVFGFSIFAYTALDGFDIGVGCLHLFTRSDLDRRIFMNAIGPVWDSNALWVIITFGSLMAGFPQAFAVILSALYTPMMVLIFGYIMRSVAMEFRSKFEGKTWRTFWDIMFFLSSMGLAFGFGVLIANLIRGIPLDHDGVNSAGLLFIFKPYSITVGFFAILLFMLHGALYLNMKTEHNLQKRIQRWINRLLFIFIFSWVLLTMITLIYFPHMADIFRKDPQLFLLTLIPFIGFSGIIKSLSMGWEGRAFISSFLVIGSLIITYSLGTFPYLVRSSIDSEMNSYTIYNSSSSPLTLKIIIGMALAGVPLFILYCTYTYKVFRGKVQIESMSY